MSNVVFRPTVVIGLGGTGNAVVRRLKQRFVDTYGSVPKIIRFLTIDTTENAEVQSRSATATTEASEGVQLDPNEQYVLQVGNPAGLIGGPNPHIDEWWPTEIPTSAITAGAGQVRARGRLALFARAPEVYARIETAMNDVRNIRTHSQMYREQFQVSERPGVEVYIVSSLAGGTGSGLFLDISFMARAITGDSEPSNFTGVLLLPRLFSHMAGVPLVKSNAYGALKEIEHLSITKEHFSVDYGFKKVEVTRPPFDLLYLLDSINEQGRVVTDQRDLMTMIADGLYVQIGSQIGTDNMNAVDNIKTQISVAGRVKGRLPAYCSFGVASLAMPSFEALIYEDAKRLVIEDLLNGSVADAEVEAEVEQFIDLNRLREDNADQVIEFLSQREGGGQLRFPMPLGQLKYDNNALAAIRNLHTVHRSRAERQIAEAIAANFETLRDGAVAAINSIWEASIGRVHGLTRAEHFFQKLQAKLEWYRNMMDTEAKEERTKDRALNFKSAEDQITEAVGAFFRRDARIRTACETYGGIVDRQTVLTISVARLEKAAELYAALHAHAQSVLNACERIRENLNASRRNFEQQHQDAKSSRGTSRLFEQVVEFDAAASRPAIAGADFVKWYADHSGSLSQWSKLRADEVHRDIEEFVRNRYEPLAALTVEDILRRSTPEEVGQELKRLDNLSVPLWRHDIGRIPVISQTVINELHHYGIADAESSVLKDAKYAAAVPRGNSLPSMVSTRDPQRIVLFKVKTGLPLFALSDIEDLERAYLDPGKIISSHIHRKWSDLPNLIPRSGDGEALRWFALAQAPEPFGLIQRIGNWYSMRSKSGRRVDDNMVRLAQGRVPAYTTFEKNRELVQEAKEVIDGVVTREGRGKVIQLLKDYSESLSRQMSGAVEPAVKDQVESEIVAIEEYVRKMETLS